MGDITVKIDASATIAALEALKPKINTATRKATQQSGDALRASARSNFSGFHPLGWHHVGDNARPNTVTGDLKMSIIPLTPTAQIGPGIYHTRIGPTMVYSRVIELGARITPQAAHYLSWFDAQMTTRRYEKEVIIPPRPYFTPARMSLGPKMESLFYSAWRAAWSA